MRPIVLAAFAAAVLTAIPLMALADPPQPLPDGSSPWGKPRSTGPGAGDYAKAARDGAVEEGPKVSAAGKNVQAAYKAMKEWEALTDKDARLEPNYQPPGAPAVPSRCLENKDCRPCYEQAYGGVNRTRRNLEKVRAHYDYTHRLTTKGKAFMQGVANVAGGVAALGAQVEADKVDASLAGFDKVVRDKNVELLGKLEENLREVSMCEAKFYRNDDWYDRYGYTYYQFMLAQYGYAQSLKP